MAASKKQVGELENAIVILEERLEKLEEEHTMMKQMLSMQNALIDNLQMMVKMMSPMQGYQVGYVQLGGKQQQPDENLEASKKALDESDKKDDVEADNETTTKTKRGGGHKKFQHTLEARMRRVM
jgi:hypothetical protein